jgi:pyruvate/2-oxoglutarate dehydrogenase complex dihydrolipoamide dehydrogenase (E3) component
VYLCDQARQIGGVPRLLGQDPNRRNLLDHAAYFEAVLKDLPVTWMLGNTVVADELIAFEPDAVVVATGGTPMVPEVDGIDSPSVMQALDVLKGAPIDTEAVVVVGGLESHLGPPTIAEYLADSGRSVTLVSEQLDFSPGVEDGTRYPLIERLARKRVTVALGSKLVAVEGSGALVESVLTRDQTRLSGVTVVLACGLVPNDGLARQLEGRVPEVHVIGDALAPRRIMHATVEGARVAMAI